MERSAALKKLGKLLGKDLAWQVDPKALKAEEREAAKVELAAVVPAHDKLKEQRDAREKEILANDAEYQRLSAECKVAREKRDRLRHMTHHYRITVGTSNGLFFSVKAEGDNWTEVIAKVEAKGR